MVFPQFRGKNGGFLSMRMQVILASLCTLGPNPYVRYAEGRVQGLD